MPYDAAYRANSEPAPCRPPKCRMQTGAPYAGKIFNAEFAYVRLGGTSGHREPIPKCPLMTQSGHWLQIQRWVRGPRFANDEASATATTVQRVPGTWPARHTFAFK